MKKIFIIFLFVQCLLISVHTQISPLWCGQQALQDKLMQNNAYQKLHLKEQSLLNSLTQLYQGSKGVVYTIPVVFHVVHNNGDEKIDRDQIPVSYTHLTLPTSG